VGSDRSERTYRLEPLDTSGVFLGLGMVQCVLLGSGITLAVLAITAGAPLPVAIGAVLAAAGASFARAGRHPLWEWLPLGAGWVWRRLRHGTAWRAPLPLHPTTSSAAMPPCLAGLDVVTIGARGGEVGAIRDRHRHTLTVVVPVTGPQFTVEPRPEQERLLAGWGDVLGQFAVERGLVTHLAWSDLARPSGMHEHQHWIDTATHGQIHPTAADSYRDLVALGTASATSHEVVVTLTVARDRLGRHRSSGGNAQAHLERGLITSLEALLRGLRSAGLTAGDPLDPLGVQRLIRTRIDPVATGRPVRRGGRLRDRLIHLQACTAGPLALSTEWRHVRVDSVWHRTWWVGTWPRLAVPPSWLEPFLSGGGITRTMTVVIVPVPTHQSRRRIERDLVKLESDATTKEEKGRRVDARHRRSTQALLDREEELVAGYPEMAYAGLVTVTAADLDTLEDHAEIVEQLARENGMDLRLLDARQDLAWAAALPLGLAPATVLAT
jgi:hypothetical protein